MTTIDGIVRVNQGSELLRATLCVDRQRTAIGTWLHSWHMSVAGGLLREFFARDRVYHDVVFLSAGNRTRHSGSGRITDVVNAAELLWPGGERWQSTIVGVGPLDPNPFQAQPNG